MNIEKFIEESLKQIIQGVKKAQESTRLPNKHHSEANLINPGKIMNSADHAPKGKYFFTVGRNIVHFVDFDIAVTTDYKDEAKAGVDLKVAGFGIGGGGSIAEGVSNVSRIKFQVPLIFPESEEEKS